MSHVAEFQLTRNMIRDLVFSTDLQNTIQSDPLNLQLYQTRFKLMEGIPQVEMDWVSHVLHVKNCQQNNEPRNISPWSLKSYELRHEAALSPHGLTRAELKRLTADRPVDSLSHVKHEVLTTFFQLKLHSHFGDWPTWASDWIWTPIFCEGGNCVTTTPPSNSAVLKSNKFAGASQKDSHQTVFMTL